MITHAIGIGIMASFIFTELVGISAGGLIVPGYLAFFWDQPTRLVATFVVAFISFCIVQIISRYVILYSRRRFMATVLVGYLLGWSLAGILPVFPVLGQDMRVIGYIIPGLIANDMVRQGVIRTVVGTLLVSIIVRLATLLLLI